MCVIANAWKLWLSSDSYFTNKFPIESSCAPSHFFPRFDYTKWLPGGHLENIKHTLLSPLYKNCCTYQFLDSLYDFSRRFSCAPDHFSFDLKIQYGCLVAILKMFVIANSHKLWCRLDSYFTHQFPTRSSCAPIHFFPIWMFKMAARWPSWKYWTHFVITIV